MNDSQALYIMQQVVYQTDPQPTKEELRKVVEYLFEQWTPSAELKKQLAALGAELNSVKEHLEEARAELAARSTHGETCPVCDGTGRCSCDECAG